MTLAKNPREQSQFVETPILGDMAMRVAICGMRQSAAALAHSMQTILLGTLADKSVKQTPESYKAILTCAAQAEINMRQLDYFADAVDYTLR